MKKLFKLLFLVMFSSLLKGSEGLQQLGASDISDQNVLPPDIKDLVLGLDLAAIFKNRAILDENDLRSAIRNIVLFEDNDVKREYIKQLILSVNDLDSLLAAIKKLANEEEDKNIASLYLFIKKNMDTGQKYKKFFEDSVSNAKKFFDKINKFKSDLNDILYPDSPTDVDFKQAKELSNKILKKIDQKEFKLLSSEEQKDIIENNLQWFIDNNYIHNSLRSNLSSNTWFALSYFLEDKFEDFAVFFIKNNLTGFYTFESQGDIERTLPMLILLLKTRPDLQNKVLDNISKYFFNVIYINNTRDDLERNYNQNIPQITPEQVKELVNIPMYLSNDIYGERSIVNIYFNPLLLAVNYGKMKIANKLLSLGAHVYDYEYALKYNLNERAADLFSDDGSIEKFNLGSSYVLSRAVNQGKKELVRHLLEHGAVIDESKFNYQTDDREIKKMLDKILYVSQGSLFGALKNADENSKAQNRIIALLELGIEPTQVLYNLAVELDLDFNLLDIANKIKFDRVAGILEFKKALDYDVIFPIDADNDLISDACAVRKRSLKVDDNVAGTSAAKRHHNQ